MRSSLLIGLLLLLAPPAMAGEADNFLKICAVQQDATACETDAKQFTKWYAAALKRDYTSQRNVAFTFSSGRSAAVVRDLVQGCAWRMVIIASGSPEVDGGDQMNLQTECGRLSAVEMARAKARATAITKTIAAGGEPAKPAAAGKPKKPTQELDGTAEPL
ncbi:hypothetical protein [Microvirga terricola]|uniref:Lysozyme inhibitor LprI N-terminal domain-containing protein n=1 Tax=Microvirga terricola TaxID=2719797 RepID=A0ABX0V6D5_9HYPH|nr:hypothetical protein [Microvirga terricola]NIX75374.1 hypothetical protein [Microvirga terricola]